MGDWGGSTIPPDHPTHPGGRRGGGAPPGFPVFQGEPTFSSEFRFRVFLYAGAVVGGVPPPQPTGWPGGRVPTRPSRKTVPLPGLKPPPHFLCAAAEPRGTNQSSEPPPVAGCVGCGGAPRGIRCVSHHVRPAPNAGRAAGPTARQEDRGRCARGPSSVVELSVL